MKTKTKNSFVKKAARLLAALALISSFAISCALLSSCEAPENGGDQTSITQQTSGSEKQFNQPSNGGYFQGHDD